MLRIIGDIHGNILVYKALIKDCDYSVQLGDLAFDYDFMKDVHHKNVFFKGNHDNHDQYSGHDLGYYGQASVGGHSFFFVSGEFSIDWKQRVQYEQLGLWPKTWWANEELTEKQLEKCIEKYWEIRPDVVISHGCPRSIVDTVNPNKYPLISCGFDPETFTTRTSEALEKMFVLHKPKVWVFGHYHTNFSQVIGGTKFICVNESDYIDWIGDKFYNKNGELI